MKVRGIQADSGSKEYLMIARTFLSALAFPLALALAQTPAPTPTPATPPAAPEMPADAKAYQAATRITDPDKKIAALEKLKLDFPQSNYLQTADNAILSALLKSKPDEKDRIRKTAELIYRNAAAKDKEASRGATIVTTRNRESAALQIADQFLAADKYLKEADAWAKRSLDPMRKNVWISEQRESFQKRKQKIPSQEELGKRFDEMRATRIGTLGRIEWKLGHEAAARKLLEESYSVNATNVAVAGALGEAAMKADEDAKALDYMIPVRLSGRAPATTNAAFETLYKRSHNGTLDGLEAMLDTEYRKRFPNPVHAEHYQPTEKRSDRMVLGEVFTGSGCPPCAAADLAFDAAMERYAPKDFAVVMYHQHIPRPDPMTTPETTARAKFYAVRGVPTFAVDGKDTIGGGSREMTQGIYDKLVKDLNKAMETAAEAHIRLEASLHGNAVRASAAVDQVKGEFKELRVQILLVEKELRFNGENGVRFHPMVVRAFGGEKGDGYPLEAAGGNFTASFELDAVSKAIKDHLDDYEAKGHRGESFKFAEKKYAIDRGDLAVVAFVQDSKTKQVLQAAWVDLAVPGAHPTTEVNANPFQ
jgi:thiol-disulfide isomerase/thioredoxin